LHILHRNLEWYAQLIYTSNGKTLEDIEDLEMVAEDAILFNLGSAAYTSVRWGDVNTFEVENRFPDFFDNNSYMIASLHSHHNMSNFFSGTDNDDLIHATESYAKACFVSLICDHRGDYSARIGFITDSNNELWQYNKLIAKFDEPTFFYADCKIVYEFKEDPENQTVRLYNALKGKHISELKDKTPQFSKKFLSLFTDRFFLKEFMWTDESFGSMLADRVGGIEALVYDIEHYFKDVVSELLNAEFPFEDWEYKVPNDEFVATLLVAHIYKEMKSLSKDLKVTLWSAFQKTGLIK